MDVFIISLILLIFVIILLYLLTTSKFSYWRKRNVPHPKPWPLLGNYGSVILLKEYVGHAVQKICQQYPEEPYIGAFVGTEPVLIVQDPEVLKLVFTKDFYYFNAREISAYADREIITKNMFFTHGDSWKITRQTLTPLFTSAKMKNMFHLIEKCAHKFEDMLDYETSISRVIEARNTMARYTMDCICSCAFGIEANTLARDQRGNAFHFMSDEIFNSSKYRAFKNICRSIWPAIFYGLGFNTFPPTIGIFFSQLLREVFESRGHKPTSRNDFVDLMLSLKNDSYVLTGDSISNLKTGGDKRVHLQIDDEYLVTQSVLFFGAGFETSSTTLGFLLYELAKNQEAQTRAIEEVDAYLLKHANKINYDCVTELPYLEACLYETVRRYPVFGNLTREVMEDCTFPNGLQLDKGVRVHIPVYGMHHNPKYFPEPYQFRPERFLPDQMKNVQPFTFFPFGGGPRLCIGKRFAKMQVLSGLLTFLKKFKVDLADGMPRDVPLESGSILIRPKYSGLYLKVTERDDWKERVYVQ